MEKKELKLRAFVAPTPTVIVSAYDASGNPDACTLAFCMMSSHVPPCVTIAINATAKRKTLQSILHSGAFVVGYPGEEHVKEADYLGVETGYNADKLKLVGFTTEPAKTVPAPLIREMKVSLECEVVHTVTVGSHTQITGEIKTIQADPSVLNEKGRVLLEELKPLIYDEETFSYHHLGEVTAPAFKTGAALRKAFQEKKDRE